MIGETTDALSRLRYLRHRSSARCPYLMINETGHRPDADMDGRQIDRNHRAAHPDPNVLLIAALPILIDVDAIGTNRAAPKRQSGVRLCQDGQASLLAPTPNLCSSTPVRPVP
jgi:hypothetical protein